MLDADSVGQYESTGARADVRVTRTRHDTGEARSNQLRIEREGELAVSNPSKTLRNGGVGALFGGVRLYAGEEDTTGGALLYPASRFTRPSTFGLTLSKHPFGIRRETTVAP